MNENPVTALSYRCRFEKCGPIRYISHLDLTRAFHRAFIRAEIPLKFSEGFSPHPKFAFALPLSTGTESLVEMADFTLKPGFVMEPEALRAALQKEMPAGIRLLSVKEEEGKFSEIALASYSVLLPETSPDRIPAAQEALKGEIVIKKKNKKGKWVEKEISGGMEEIRFLEENGALRMEALLSVAGDSYLKPETVLDVLKERLGDESFSIRSIRRTGVYKIDRTPF